MIPLTHFINLNCHSMFLLHSLLHYNELDSLNYANERNDRMYESLTDSSEDHMRWLVFSELSEAQSECALYTDSPGKAFHTLIF